MADTSPRVSVLFLFLVCVRVLLCACAENKTDSELQFSAHPPTLSLWRILPSLLSANLNKHFLFIQHSYHSLSFSVHFFGHFVHLCRLLCQNLFSFFPSLSLPSFSLLFLVYFMFLHLSSSSPSSSSRNLRQPSSIIQWTEQRYTSFPSPDLLFILLCHSPPLPHLLLPFDPSFHYASV